MCRRCGEPDRRGSASQRRARKRWMLTEFGTGKACPCWLCGKRLTFLTVQADRIVPGCEGGTYRRENIRPACGPCNRARAYPAIPVDCAFG